MTDEAKKQAFRAGDSVDIRVGLIGPGMTAEDLPVETWLIAVYEADLDVAWIAGWPCTMVANASKHLKLSKEANDIEHARMVRDVREAKGNDYGFGDPRRSVLERVLKAGGVP